MDKLDKLREKFLIPHNKQGEIIYFLGNSLGLQPKKAKININTTMSKWHELGVEAFSSGEDPWIDMGDSIHLSMSKVLGTNENEIAIMNTLTTNLHLALVSFYRPTKDKYKIVMEKNAFPTDIYAIKSQMRFHGINPDEGIIFAGDDIYSNEDLDEILEKEGENIALILFAGVNYYTGQVFDLKHITKKAKLKDIIVGFDLAHWIGNIETAISEFDADFAVWCNYKYMNAGPGAPGGLYINKKHYKNTFEGPRFEGWWGNKRASRFLMRDNFEPEKGASAWQLSTASPIMLSAMQASLEIFDEIGMKKLRERSKKLTGYLRSIIPENFEIITPENSASQLSLRVKAGDKKLFDYLMKNNVFSDWREPDVIRVAPIASYTQFEELDAFVNLLKKYA